MSCSRYFGPTQSKYLTQGFHTEMSLEYLGFKQEGCPRAERAASFPRVGDGLLGPQCAFLCGVRPPSSSAPPPHTCPAVSSQVSPSCSSVNLVWSYTSASLCLCSVFPSYPPSPLTSGLFLKTTPPHPTPSQLSRAFPDRVEILSSGHSIDVFKSLSLYHSF